MRTYIGIIGIFALGLRPLNFKKPQGNFLRSGAAAVPQSRKRGRELTNSRAFVATSSLLGCSPWDSVGQLGLRLSRGRVRVPKVQANANALVLVIGRLMKRLGVDGMHATRVRGVPGMDVGNDFRTLISDRAKKERLLVSRIPCGCGFAAVDVLDGDSPVLYDD
jgi:hypothetical protein